MKKAQLILTEMPGCATALQGQGLCSAEQLRGPGAGDPRGSQTFAWDCGHSLPPEIQGLTCFFQRLTIKTPLLRFYSRTAEMRRGGGQVLLLRLLCLWDFSVFSSLMDSSFHPENAAPTQVLNLIPKANNFSKGIAT